MAFDYERDEWEDEGGCVVSLGRVLVVVFVVVVASVAWSHRQHANTAASSVGRFHVSTITTRLVGEALR